MDTMVFLQDAAGAEGLDGAERDALGLLVRQLAAHAPGNEMRSLYYNGKQSLQRAGLLGMAIPGELAKLETALGWPAKAVTTLEHRLNLQGFVMPDGQGRDEGLDDIWRGNRMDAEASMAHTASLIHGTAFVTVSAGDTAAGEPAVVIAARSAREATALWSRRSREITAGLTVNASDGAAPVSATLWLPDRAVTLTQDGSGVAVRRVAHRLGRVPMVMLPFRPHLEREFGVPRITGAVMGLTDAAVRTVLRMEATAEFFSFPQRYGLGVAAEDFSDTFKTYLNRFLALGRDDSGELPQLGTFASSSPQPHIDQLRALASMFSGETSIPLNYLGIVHDNPSSADAIRAAEADLITVVERAQTVYGAAWRQVMMLAQQVRDGGPDPRMVRAQPQWRDAATPTKAANAQAVMALVSAGVLPAMSEVTWRLLGYDEATIIELSAGAARSHARDTESRLTMAVERRLAEGAAPPSPAVGDAASGSVTIGEVL